MLNKLSKLVFLLFTSVAIAQTGHLMQGVGAVNMSMGGAATAQPLDISGAMQWNPAALSVFDGSILKLDVGMFKGTPTLYSTIEANAMGPGNPPMTLDGSTESELGYMPMPALAFAWGNADSKHTFGISVFGEGGFGVDFPQETNLPDANFDPSSPTNPINYPQSMGGFGHLKSSFMLMQVSFTWAYQISDKFSIGVQPIFDYQTLELKPNPLANPNASGYPETDGAASAIGFGGQFGLFFDSQNGFKLGASYRSQQFMNEFEFDNIYLNDDTSTNNFTMGVPAIYSVGLGYSKGIIDFALDYRYVDYAGTEGFEETGWTQFGAVEGFGWESISIVSAGLQLKAIKKVPLRFGYTYSTNPINEELVFYSTPATAIIAHAFQFGFSILFSDAFSLDAVYHYGMSDGETEGKMLNPMMASPSNPLGAMENTRVAYDMNTQLFMLGLQFKFGGKDTDGDGVKDKDDSCPEIPGIEQFNGCPDSDGDGIKDSEDSCPDVAGLAALNGCPDSDGDGFSDKEDLCPEVAGLEQFNGCPDTDGDGVMDSKDECPNEAGLIDNNGCPLVDTDGDGIVDKNDNCPNIAGSAENNGCPVVTEEVQKEITDLARAIYFNTGKFTFTDETKIRLEKIYDILDDYPNSKFRVEGHTDSSGSAEFNKSLSQKRADAVMTDLVDKGFDSSMIRATGFGEDNPIGDNKTKKGMQANRRVEIFLEK